MRRHVTSACRLTLLYITPERAENYILAYYYVFFHTVACFFHQTNHIIATAKTAKPRP